MPLPSTFLGVRIRLAELGVRRPNLGRAWRYLLRDKFSTPQSAPLAPNATQRAAEPGPGAWKVTDASNIISIAGGYLVVNGTTAALSLVADAAAPTRATGRAFLVSVPTRTTTLGYWRIGLAPSGGEIDYGLDILSSSTTTFRIKTTSTVIDNIVAGAGEWQLAVIMRGTGAFLLWRIGQTGQYTLAWVYNNGASPEGSILWGPNANTQSITLDDWRVVDLPAPFNSDYGIATSRAISPAPAATQARTADAIIEYTTVVPPNSEQAIHVRYVDSNNRWKLTINSTGSLLLNEVNAGVATPRGSYATGLAIGAAVRISCVNVGNVFTAYVNNTLAFTYTDPGSFLATNLVVQWQGGTTPPVNPSDIVCWPRTVTIDETSAPVLFRENFAYDQAAPLLPAPARRVMEPGPGVWGVIANDGTLAVSGGALQMGAQATPVWGDQGLHSTASHSRLAGRALLGRFQFSTVSHNVVQIAPTVPSSGFTNPYGLYIDSGAVSVDSGGGTRVVAASIALGAGIPYEFALVERATGCLFLIRGGIYASWTLLWVSATGVLSPLYAQLLNYQAVGALDYLRVDDLGGAIMRDDWALALARSTFTAPDGTPLTSIVPETGPAWVALVGAFAVSGNKLQPSVFTATHLPVAAVETGASDVIIEATIRFSTVGTAIANIVVRWVDINNYWVAQLRTDTNTVAIVEINASVATQRGTGALTFLTATDYRLVVIAVGTTITAYVNNTQYATYASAALNQTITRHGISYYQVSDLVHATYDTFIVWPRTPLLQTPADTQLGPFRFGTAMAAPLPTSYTEAGAVGALTVVDTENKLVVTGGALTFTPRAIPAWGDPGIWGGASARLAGRAVLVDFRIVTTGIGGVMVGWDTDTLSVLAEAYLIGSGANLTVYLGGPTITLSIVLTQGVDYTLAIVQRGTGAHYLIRGGAFGKWTLVWIDNAATNASLRAALTSHNIASGLIDNLRVSDLGGKFASDFGLALARSTFTASNGTALTALTPEAGPAWVAGAGTFSVNANKIEPATLASGLANTTVDTGASDVVVEVTIRFPASPSGTLAGVSLRAADASNRWEIQLRGDNQTVAIYEVVAGTPTLRASAAFTLVAATDYRFVVVAQGASIGTFVNNIASASYASAATGLTVTKHGLYYFNFGSALNATFDDFIVWPRYPDLSMLDDYLVGPFRFATAVAAPLPATYVEAGARGTLTVADTSSRLFIDSGKLQSTSGGSGGNPAVWSQAVSRQAGRTMAMTITVPASFSGKEVMAGWSDTQSGYPRSALWFSLASNRMAYYCQAVGGANPTDVVPLVGVGTTHEIALVLRSNGAIALIRPSGSSNYTVAWVDNNYSSATVYAFYGNAPYLFLGDDLRVFDLPGQWTSDYGIALARSTFTGANGTALTALVPEIGPAWVAASGTFQVQANQATPLSADPGGVRWVAVQDAGQADCLVECTITLQSSGQASLVFRYTDTGNLWILHLSDPANTLEIYERVGGTFTLRASTAMTLAPATPYRCVVVAQGASISTFVNNTAGPTYATAATGLSATMHGFRSEGSGNTFDDFVVWPRTIAALPEPGTAQTLLRDDFTTDRAALVSRVMEPGPGEWLVTDTNNGIVISGGTISLTGTSTFETAKLVSAAGYARTPGRTMLFQRVSGVGNAEFGWSLFAAGSWDSIYGVRFSSGGWVQLYTVAITGIGTFDEYAVILRAVGCHVLARNVGGPWSLVWVHNAGSEATLYPALNQYTNVTNVLDNVRVADLGGQWLTDWGIALNRSTFTAANGTAVTAITPEVGGAWQALLGAPVITGNVLVLSSFTRAVVDSGMSDVIVEAAITMAAGESPDILVRAVDSNNHWSVRLTQATGTLDIFERVVGATTNRASGTITLTAGVAYRVVVVVAGTTIAAYVNNTLVASYASMAVFGTATKHGLGNVFPNAPTADNFIVWPRNPVVPSGV